VNGKPRMEWKRRFSAQKKKSGGVGETSNREAGKRKTLWQ